MARVRNQGELRAGNGLEGLYRVLDANEITVAYHDEQGRPNRGQLRS